MNPDGSGRVQLTNDPGNELRPSYSADGERILYAFRPVGTTSSQIWAMNADGSAQTPLTTPAPGQRQRADVLARRDAASSSSAAQCRRAEPDLRHGLRRLQRRAADGPGPRRRPFTEPQYSPDGSRIVFVRQTGGTGRFEIWVMNADGSGQTPLTTVSGGIQDGGPSFSPDGQRIAWSRFTGPPPNQDIYIMNADGSGQTQVTSGPGQDYAPEFSPDGTRIVFERESQNFQYSDILLADPNGLDLGITPLTANQAPDYDSNPAWQPLNPPNCTITADGTQKQTKSIELSIACQNENATVVAEGQGKAPKPKSGALASKAKRFTIPAVSGQAPREPRRRSRLRSRRRAQRRSRRPPRPARRARRRSPPPSPTTSASHRRRASRSSSSRRRSSAGGRLDRACGTPARRVAFGRCANRHRS